MFIDASRARAIVKKASALVKDPKTKSWLQTDERGFWEAEARRLIETAAEKHPTVGADEVDEQAAFFIGLRALEVVKADLQKRLDDGTKKPRNRKA